MMLRSVHTSNWATGAYATIATMPDDGENATVLLMDGCRRMTELVLEMCEVMGMRLVHVHDAASLRGNLWGRQPVGVLCDATRHGAGSADHVLKLVADYDRTLPLLLVADANPSIQGEIDAVEDICRLTHVTRLTVTPSPFDIAAFMFETGRLCGRNNALPM